LRGFGQHEAFELIEILANAGDPEHVAKPLSLVRDLEARQ
jgi:hypothetical protein